MTEPGTREYSQSLYSYQDYKRLPEDIFRTPDHVVLVPPTMTSFQGYVSEFKALSERGAVLDADERFRVAVKLTGVLSVGSFGYVKWVEIREPVVELPGETQPYVAYMNFFYPAFGEVSKVLEVRSVKHEATRADTGERLISVVYDPNRGREFRISDKPLEELVDRGLQNGDYRPLL